MLISEFLLLSSIIIIFLIVLSLVILRIASSWLLVSNTIQLFLLPHTYDILRTYLCVWCESKKRVATACEMGGIEFGAGHVIILNNAKYFTKFSHKLRAEEGAVLRDELLFELGRADHDLGCDYGGRYCY